ncbi:MAG: hypothetical protein AAGH15_18465, partial [Myxococcota bacterium]
MTSRPFPPTLASLTLGLSLLTFACGDDAADPTDAGLPDTGGADGGLADEGAADLGMEDAGMPPDGFIVCGVTISPAGLTGFAVLSPSLDAGTEVDLADSLEFGGIVSCANLGRTLYVTGGEAAEVRRFQIGDGEPPFTEDGAVSFAGEGVGAGGSIVVVSDTKAYYVDETTLSVVIWNPTTLLIEGSLSLEGLEAPEGEGVGINGVQQRAGRVVVIAGYGSAVTGNEQRIRVALIDPETDAVTVDETTTCGGSFTSADGGDGFIYLGAGVRPAVSFRLGLPGTYAPCLVRVDAATGEFDDAFLRELNALTGVDPTGVVSPGPRPGTMLLTGYDESIEAIPDDAADFEVQQAESWRTYLLEDLGGDAPATLLDALPVVTGITSILNIG